MKLFIAAVVLVSVSACSQASVQQERFRTVYIDGVKCVVYQPYDGDAGGTQMECDFK